MNCPHCNAVIPESGTACPACRLTALPVAPAPKSIHRLSHIPPATWVLAVIAGIIMLLPVYFLQYGARDWLKLNHPLVFQYRTGIASLYGALCIAGCNALTKICARRQPNNASSPK